MAVPGPWQNLQPKQRSPRVPSALTGHLSSSVSSPGPAPAGRDDVRLSDRGVFFTKRRQSPHAVGSQCADIIPIYGLILENLTSRASHETITGKNRGAHVSFPQSTLSKRRPVGDAARGRRQGPAEQRLSAEAGARASWRCEAWAPGPLPATPQRAGTEPYSPRPGAGGGQGCSGKGPRPPARLPGGAARWQ